MNTLTFGDLARSFQMRSQQISLKGEIERLTTEVTTGQVTDVAEAVRGDFRPLAAIENGLELSLTNSRTIEETTNFAEAVQTALARIEDQVQKIGPDLAIAATGLADVASLTVAEEAENGFEVAVSALNSRFAGRALFSGVDTDVAALTDGATMLADLRVAVAAETTAAGVATVVDTWFGPGGDFETLNYNGAATSLAPFQLSEGESVEFSFRADDDRARDVLKGLALGALLQDGPLTGLPDENLALANLAADQVLDSGGPITYLRSEVGSAEARIETVRTKLETERNSLELARNRLLESDPYSAATRLQELQSQLETLFAITARTSRLSLADYL